MGTFLAGGGLVWGGVMFLSEISRNKNGILCAVP